MNLTASATACGHIRKENQDVSRICAVNDGVLCLICDGMGGRAGGLRAATLAADIFSYTLKERTRFFPKKTATETVKAALTEALNAANRAVYDEAETDVALSGMGTTLAALFLYGKYAYILHVGDSRVWLLRGEKLRLLTADHTAAGENRSTVLTRAVGVLAEAVPDVTTVSLRRGDRFLLTTDGLHNALDTAALSSCLRRAYAPSEAAEMLVGDAASCAGNDNMTAVVLFHDVP